jgi:hypothetical protein
VTGCRASSSHGQHHTEVRLKARGTKSRQSVGAEKANANRSAWHEYALMLIAYTLTHPLAKEGDRALKNLYPATAQWVTEAFGIAPPITGQAVERMAQRKSALLKTFIAERANGFASEMAKTSDDGNADPKDVELIERWLDQNEAIAEAQAAIDRLRHKWREEYPETEPPFALAVHEPKSDNTPAKPRKR